ncbi:DUF4253 domain-containing protein [Clostridiaceae bacterium M8S5]|nr:DUF4253 domain-containing protein [Clostridiaceae bacterium M8S5]
MLQKMVIILILISFLLLCTACKEDSTLEIKNSVESDNETSFDIKKEIKLPFDYIVVSGEDALETCLKIREEKEDITPVILGTYDDVMSHEEIISYNKDLPDDIIKESLDKSVKNIFKERLGKVTKIYDCVELGKWPSVLSPMTSITSNINILTGEYHDEIYIGLIPTQNSYEVPAYIKFGGWNCCPSPESQIALLKYWYDKYGAEVISITRSTLECTVAIPPKTKEESIKLAEEQFIYCNDIVYQGTETISNLAGGLYKSNYWFFWWD